MWLMNETYEMNTSSRPSVPNFTLLSRNSNESENTRSDVLRRLTITSVLLVFGVLGNTSIILVLRRLKSATSILTIYMAVFDTLSLMSKVLTDVLDYYNTDNFGYLYCVTMTIPIVAFVALANWTLVVICIERFLSIFFPFHYKSFVSTERLHVTMATMACIFTSYAVLFNAMTRTYDEDSNKCILINISGIMFYIIMNTVACVGPCLFSTVITILVIVKVHIFQENFKNVNKSKIRQRLEGSLSRIMLCSSILFNILNLPETFYFSFFWQTYRANHVVESFLVFLRDLSHVMNFLVYLIFVQRIRESFREIFHRRSRDVWSEI
ncbi:uncharacterized protein LOC106069811 [Biomphalaria glabrata]|uniref:Uncharacterized protein LOC106069811 n=1 Tax=Biomphalaria glabrata TaxID=6526 RepID=A0A9W3BQH7_BIOGL|nr:uncharacterized protein LOC106069811 [Biomphalaria glabrata]